ncbi:MAG: S41 family peptidase, partial [Bacteroidota bacterium]
GRLHKLPFKITVSESGISITKSFLPETSHLEQVRLISINGVPTKDIVHRLTQLIPSDGYNVTGKYHQLSAEFVFYYSLVYGLKERVKLDYIPHNGEKVLSADVDLISKEKWNELQIELTPHENDFQFSTLDGIGILKVGTFNGAENFTRFIDESFQKLSEENVGQLIIDLRNNGGGEETNAIHLYSYLAAKDFKYYDRYEVKTPKKTLQKQGESLVAYETANALREVSTLDDHGRQVISKIEGIRGKLIDPNEWQKATTTNRFEGAVVVLIDGGSFSATSEVCAIMARDKRVTFFGEETGGGLDGNTSGLYDQIILPNTRITVKIPLIKYVSATGDIHHNFGRGILPDFSPSLSTMAEGKVEDTFMKNALNYLRLQR